LFVDDFATGGLGAWSVVDDGTAVAPSNWRVTGGVALQTTNIYGGSVNRSVLDKRGTYLLAGSATWRDYAINVRMRSDDDDAIGVMFGYTNANNYYRFSMDNQRGYRRLVKVVNGVWRLLKEDSLAYPIGQWQQIQASMSAGTVEVRIGGQLVFSVKDTSHTAGRIALYTWNNSRAQFDDVVVSSLIAPK
jgi:hypothetical protein